MTSSSSLNIPLLTIIHAEMSFVDQEPSNVVLTSARGRLQQKLGTRLTKRTVFSLNISVSVF